LNDLIADSFVHELNVCNYRNGNTVNINAYNDTFIQIIEDTTYVGLYSGLTFLEKTVCKYLHFTHNQSLKIIYKLLKYISKRY